MKSFEKKTVSVEVGETDRPVSFSVYRSGHRERSVLFLHGLAGCAEAFETCEQAFGSSEWRIFIPDLPGHGSSESKPWYSYTPDWYREVLLAWVRQLSHPPDVMVGHSMGGTIGLLLCEALASTPFLFSVEGLPESLSFLERRVRRYGHLDAEEGFRRVRVEFQNVDDPGLQTWLQWTERCHPEAFFQSARHFVSLWDEKDMMDRFRQYPSDRRFYICGSNGQAEYVKRELPEDAFGEVPGTGHFPMVTQPEAFWSMIRRVTQEHLHSGLTG